MAPEWDDPAGVPISAILFGGRRAGTVPLVVEALGWEHGVYLAANLSSEGTAAAKNALGAVRRDPFAMLPFCGYSIADYYEHWLRLGAAAGSDAGRLTRVFLVNWFRKNDAGRFLWPGFGENVRALKWIVERCDGIAEAAETPIGRVPTLASLDTEGLSIAPLDLERLLRVDVSEWIEEAKANASELDKLVNAPPALQREQVALDRRLVDAL